MNEELDSQLSAMFDDELAAAECELLARRLSRDELLKARWGRYAVIGAAIRAERGVRLHARVATRVSHVMRSEPVLSAGAMSRTAAARWWRPLAGVAVAAGVAAVSILWLRAQAPDSGVLSAGPPVAALPAARATPTAEAAPLRTAARATPADSYVVPPAAHGNAAAVPVPELANYVVAHSMFSPPMARGTLLSSFMTNDTVAGVTSAVSSVADPAHDAHSQAQ
ncbi:MAG TPA: sigma-E factor negative regulatory protein [Steroidobacteraceae bacterium]|jgi:negative regulator of sigma E activity|nr:sigma-E factor negative regulatory protein [Steroidobacteraceae bacterium]